MFKIIPLLLPRTVCPGRLRICRGAYLERYVNRSHYSQHTLADSQLVAPKSNTTEETQPAKEPVHVSPLNAVLCLVVLGINAATQRSGADHFANQHLSPARTSPFICLADILVTIIWLVYGVCHEKISIKASAKMLFKDFDFSEEEDTLGVGNRWSWSIVLVLLFAVGVLVEAIKLFAFAATGTAPWLQTFAAAMFFAAYVVRISVNTISRLCTDETTTTKLGETKADRKMLFNIADLLYNIAYSAQFRFWIATFGNLEYFARPNKKVVPTLLAIVIVPALASYFFPKEKKSQGVQPVEEQTSQSTPTGTQKPEIYGGSWSLKNWEKDDQNRAFLVLFVVMISVPLDTAWRILFIPLASLAVVVGHLSLVSLICQIVRKVKKRNSVASKTKASDNISEASVPVDEDSQAIEKQLRERWSPLLRAKDPEWRNVVSSASAVANFSFVCMYYFGIYDASKTVKPGWLEKF